ncbi:MAG: hypothetical protein HF314_06235 [Ignavibacteria bacterium]|jgi:hypothetical protein|nr:hypothetical protein [Ignavibacteria bacterium]MCU7502652.1 hypothetical protein [Ignavibacteria bacterium]MCU7515145.1 hypothetical protein [Ignavibacteria bacterium]
MRDNKRITLVSISLLVLICCIQPVRLRAGDNGTQGEITNSVLDSLYNAFLRMKGVQRLFPSMPGIGEAIPQKEGEFPGKCGFSLIAQVRRNFNNFSSGQRAVLKKLLDERPVLESSIVSPSGFFRIHFNTRGDSIPNYDTTLSVMENVNRVAFALDSAYNYEVNYLGFLPPPQDNGAGGDDLYDVYIMDISDYGYTQVGETLDPQGMTATSFMTIDNDFSRAQHFYSPGLGGLYVTAAHEFHHAIQLGNYNALIEDRDLYFYEGTSTAMEELVFDTVNDYYQYLHNYFSQPELSFYQYKATDSYTAVLWMLFQHYNFGPNSLGKDILESEWENFKREPSLKAMNTALAARGSSLKQAVNLFGDWTYFTNSRTKPGMYFKESAAYPLLKPNYSLLLTSSQQMVDVFTDPVSNNFIRYLADNGATMDTIVIILTNGDLQSALTNMENATGGGDLINERARLTLYNYEVSGAKKVANNYYYTFSADKPDIFLKSEVFNNILNNDGTFTISEVDFAFPNPFNYSKNQFIYLPVKPNRLNSAGLSIFSSSMDLVFSGEKNIIPMYDSYTVQWDATDSKGRRLPTGVYFYVTDSEGNLKKGKIVIQNE